MPSKKNSLKKRTLRKHKHRRTHKKRKTLIKRRKPTSQRSKRGHMKHSRKMFGGSNMDTLSNSEIDEILGNFGSNMDEAKRNEAKKLLKKLKFDPNYTEDCFFSKLPKHPDDDLTLREQAESKVQCWFRGEGLIE
jgi:hypothetical protein